MHNSVSQYLEQAYDFLRDPDHFIQNNDYGQDFSGASLRLQSPAERSECTATCLVGAVALAMDESPGVVEYGDAGQYLIVAAHELFPDLRDYRPITVSDNFGHDAALMVLRRAIQLAQLDEAL